MLRHNSHKIVVLFLIYGSSNMETTVLWLFSTQIVALPEGYARPGFWSVNPLLFQEYTWAGAGPLRQSSLLCRSAAGVPTMEETETMVTGGNVPPSHLMYVLARR